MKTLLSPPGASVLIVSLLVACGGSSDGVTNAAGGLEGRVTVDGSSTVFPITEAVAEEYRNVQPDVRVTVGVSGTGGGFKKFIAGETDISDASRYIKPNELEACEANGREFLEIPVAFDGLAVIVNKENDFCTTMTVDELRRMWASDAVSKKWSDIRPEWPDREFNLYAPGQDSGTFDYFTETVNGESGNCRPDSTFSEDDNVLVRGVSGDPDGIGFFGLAYYEENKSILNCVAIDGGDGPVLPNLETVENGTYAPLSRPLFIYASTKALERPEVQDFVRFYIEEAPKLAVEVGYVPMPKELYAAVLARFERRATGSQAGKEGTLSELFK